MGDALTVTVTPGGVGVGVGVAVAVAVAVAVGVAVAVAVAVAVGVGDGIDAQSPRLAVLSMKPETVPLKGEDAVVPDVVFPLVTTTITKLCPAGTVNE